MRPTTLLLPLFATLAIASTYNPLPASALSSVTANATTVPVFDEQTGILTYPSSDSNGDIAWGEAPEGVQISFGLMLERPADTEEVTELSKRALMADKVARDAFSEVMEVSFDERGSLLLHDTPSTSSDRELLKRSKASNAKKAAAKAKAYAKKRAMERAQRAAAAKKKKAAAAAGAAKGRGSTKNPSVSLAAVPKFKAVITWYTGNDLLDPYCADGSGWAPHDNSMIAAVNQHWGKGRPACGSFLRLCSPSSGKCIVVRVVDLCGGCKPGLAHVDLSLRAFSALYDLNVGKVWDIQVSTLAGPPVAKWTSAVSALYGPQHL